MKKIILGFLIVGYLYPCIITFSPKELRGKVGELKTFVVEVKNIHTPCLLPIEESNFEFENVKLVSQSKWDTIKPNLFKKIITIQLLKEGKGSVKIKRSCPVQTSSAKLDIVIEKRNFKELKEEVKNLIKKIILGEEISFDYLLITFEEFVNTYEKKKIKNEKELYSSVKEIYNYLLKIKAICEKEKE
jgi:hypothetical protein